jgi:pre-mRNA-splicing factor CWC22
VLLLEQPTDDSVEIAVGFMREVGAYLAENSPRANNGVYERFRAVLHEGAIDKRVQYMIEVLFQVRKDKYKDNVIVPEGLDLVEEDDQITHQISLDDELQIQEGLSKCPCCCVIQHVLTLYLDVFKFDPNFLENEEKYKEIKAEILGEGSDDDESGSSASESDDDDEEAGEAIPTLRLLYTCSSRSCSTRQAWYPRYDRNKLGQSSSYHLFDHHERGKAKFPTGRRIGTD